jgi:hypothetical protein
MKYLKRSAVLALPVVAAVSLGVPASAAPATNPASSVRACNPGATSYISNQGGFGIGVIESWDGPGQRYGQGLYDAVLPVGQRTDCAFGWVRAEGYYLGAGVCAALRTTNSRNEWYEYGRVGPGPLQLPRDNFGRSVERWEVNQYRC